eukprot:Nk52_evm16s2209 gene=Nk52_evmTU16s2209
MSEVEAHNSPTMREPKIIKVPVSEIEAEADEAEALKVRELNMLRVIVQEMQDEDFGINVRDRKVFLDKVPSCFTGQDVIDWLFHSFKLFDRHEALHIAQALFDAGYIFPLEYGKTIKDTTELYRFQCPLFYPRSDGWKPSDFEYAVYLSKRKLRDKKKHTLENYERDSYDALKERMHRKWEFVEQQAQESVKFSKERSNHEKKIFDSQERAFWWKYKPPPENFSESQGLKRIKGVSETKMNEGSIGEAARQPLTGEQFVLYLEDKVISYKEECENRQERLPALAEDKQASTLAMWEESVTVAMVRNWTVSFKNLMEDETGITMFQMYLKKEFSDENIKFWHSVNELKESTPEEEVEEKAKHIFNMYIAPLSPHEVNVDAATRQITIQNMEEPNRNAFDEAQKMIYLLMSKDSYPRFLRCPECQAILDSEDAGKEEELVDESS